MTEVRFKASALLWFLAASALLLCSHAAEMLPEESAADRCDRAMSDPWVVYDGFDGPGRGRQERDETFGSRIRRFGCGAVTAGRRVWNYALVSRCGNILGPRVS